MPLVRTLAALLLSAALFGLFGLGLIGIGYFLFVGLPWFSLITLAATVAIAYGIHWASERNESTGPPFGA
jgi:hypothetical protein